MGVVKDFLKIFLVIEIKRNKLTIINVKMPPVKFKKEIARFKSSNTVNMPFVPFISQTTYVHESVVCNKLVRGTRPPTEKEQEWHGIRNLEVIGNRITKIYNLSVFYVYYSFKYLNIEFNLGLYIIILKSENIIFENF